MTNTIRKNTDASARDGVARSSDEALVMRVEGRGGVSLLTSVCSGQVISDRQIGFFTCFTA